MEEYEGAPALDAGLLADAQAVEHMTAPPGSRPFPLQHAEYLGNQLGLAQVIQASRPNARRRKKKDGTLSALAETAVNAEAAQRRIET